MGGIFSIFAFCISLWVAKNIGKRQQREALMSHIIVRYCEVREIATRGKICFGRIPSMIKYQVLGMLPEEFEKASVDSHEVFTEIFKFSYDNKKLTEVRNALTAIRGNMLRILEIVETKLQTNKRYRQSMW